ncbi:thiamine pyrophosphate-binding protein [Citricoccus muralis]|uniref:Thiamine pyrophosphate-binding protein n=1 Tax=Citricoccus muralis TaxID=169134 RepID=A0ABY8H588_9MICC|nr:thiamine pyrophosphate-binding protein [Citricoccus muralis]WFP16106.1 thiamine pyrophosphate-binding protein [Citricoccus muralis]
MKVSEAVGQIIARMGAGHVFGVVGSGNFRATNALLATAGPAGHPPRFTATRHEMGAACMADAYGRVTGTFAVVTVHQGCGLSNALTGLGEAAKARTPLLVISGDTPGGQFGSNFWIDQDKVIEGMGAVAERLHSANRAVEDTVRAVTRALVDRRAVVLSMPLDIQEAEISEAQIEQVQAAAPPVHPDPAGLNDQAAREIADTLLTSERPVLLAGRGAHHAEEPLLRLGELSGALLTTSAAGRGLFVDDPWHTDVMGGFATDGAAQLVAEADLLVVFGAALNRWTTRSGALLANKTVIQIDDTVSAFGLHYPVTRSVLSDTALAAEALCAALEAQVAEHPQVGSLPRTGYRTEEVGRRLRDSLHWRDQPFEDRSEPAAEGHGGVIDPRMLTNALDEMLPMDRVVAPDGGNFNAYPAMHFRVPDTRGYSVPLAFQSIGLAISSVIGAATAQPGRVAIAGVGDGGFMMSHVELDTAVREQLPLVVVVYNDDAYGAEVHHFEHETDQLDTVVFPATDIAAIARGYGCEALTVRSVEDLAPVADWVAGPRTTPLVIDAKIAKFASWVLAHTFGADE